MIYSIETNEGEILAISETEKEAVDIKEKLQSFCTYKKFYVCKYNLIIYKKKKGVITTNASKKDLREISRKIGQGDNYMSILDDCSQDLREYATADYEIRLCDADELYVNMWLETLYEAMYDKTDLPIREAFKMQGIKVVDI